MTTEELVRSPDFVKLATLSVLRFTGTTPKLNEFINWLDETLLLDVPELLAHRDEILRLYKEEYCREPNSKINSLGVAIEQAIVAACALSKANGGRD